MEGLKGTFMTSGACQPVLDAYRELNRTIDEMDQKVEYVIKKHEAEFLYAYRSHIGKIKKELADIKHKSEEQERMFSSNDRIQYLEKEMIIFREEALKLYNKLD
jgi:septation ring formation regulator EzrA